MKRILVLAICFILGVGSAGYARDEGQSFQKATDTFLVGAISWEPTITGRAKINAVYAFMPDFAATETVSIVLDSVLGATWDVTLNSNAVTPRTSFVSGSFSWNPEYDFILERGDNLKVTVSADGQLGRAIGIVIKGERL